MADDPKPFSWQSLIPVAASTGGALLGNALNNKQQTAMTREQLAQQQKQFEANQAFRASEQARRNAMQGIASPSTLQALGYRNPGQIAGLQKQFTQQQAPTGLAPATNQGGYQVTPTQGSSLAKGIGTAGALGATGAGIASMLGVGALGGPVGLAIGGAGALGSLIASKVGQGRRAANSFVQGAENPFGADLAQIVRQKDSGDIEGAKASFMQKYADYKAAVARAQSQGGNEAKVAQQSMTNPGLQQTIQTLAAQLGVQL